MQKSKSDSFLRQLYRSICILFCLILSFGLLQAQCTLVCPVDLQLSLPQSGQFAVTTQFLAPTAGTYCPGNLDLQVTTSLGQSVPDNVITCAYVGAALTATITHTASGNQCSTTITVQDAIPPALQCADKFITCQTDPTAVPIALPSVTDNCTPVGLLTADYQDITTDLPCGTLYAGQSVTERIDRTWTITDQSGNSSTCMEVIHVRTPTLAQVVVPPHLNDIALPALACGQNYQDLALTGQPLLGELPLDPLSSCDIGATYNDQILPGCSPNSFTVMRTWLIVDFCNSNFRQHIQFIHIRDKVPPVLTVPAATTISTTASSCTATVTLPAATATDACSSVTIQPSWQFGTGYGPFASVPVGTHVVTYRATDACGNSTTATTTITVRDDSPPNTICASNVQAGLGANGSVLVNVQAINSGTWDNCDTPVLELSRDLTNWGSTVALSCADVSAPVTVTLRATDASGNSNICETTITVRDFQKPVLNCPVAITLTCLQDPDNQSVTGMASATDNCGVPTLVHADVSVSDGCQIGTVTRTWTATDAANNTRTCSQVITLVPVNSLQVIFPTAVTLNACTGPAQTDPGTTGRPVVTGQSCFEPSVTFVDEVYTIAPPACFGIIRKWKVVDHCIYQPGGTVGIWEQNQLISIIDQTPPVLTVPAAVTVSPQGGSCTTAQVAIEPATATDCSTSLTFTNNSPFANNPNSADASGTYPVGTHEVTWRVEDGCGNSNLRTTTITVVDATPPSAICRSGVSVGLGAGGVVTLLPALLDGGSFDNCTPQSQLTMQVQPAIVGCSQIGVVTATLTVTEPSGLSSTCQTVVQVQDNNQTCSRFTVQGTIKDTHGAPLPGIRVTAGQGYEALTDGDGIYLLTDLVGGQNYSIKPTHNINWKNGVTTLDLLFISQHILSLQPLGSPEKIYAADANNSGTLTAFDIVQLRKIVLDALDTIPGGQSWKFIPANYVFPNQLNPFESAVPGTYELLGLDGNTQNLDFKALKTGDMNLNANAADAAAPPTPVALQMQAIELILRKLRKPADKE
jgi:HYR domain